MSINITKQSGVISITSNGGQPKSYFGEKGKWTVAHDNITILLWVGTDSYQLVYTDLKVNGQTPSTITTAKTLLTSIFGT